MYDSVTYRRAALWWCLALLVLGPGSANPLSKPRLWAQETPTAAPAGQPESAAQANAADQIVDGTAGPSADGDPQDGAKTVSAKQPAQLHLFWLILEGGPLMIPIGLMCVFVVALVIERLFSLRRAKVMPPDLIHSLSQTTGGDRGFDPRQVYRLCQQYPSSTATVIRAMLLKVGRPQSEVEHAVSEASEREANRLYANVRWLNLAATVSPLLGLFGTVWGMIRAFFDTTHLEIGQNKADFLAAGIYVALVTTLGGLAVAIPAAIFAHYFEGRIQTRFYQIDELLFNLLPQVERYEGRLRVSRQSLGDGSQLEVDMNAGTAQKPPEATRTASTAHMSPK